MTYLTGWRIARAADLLRATDLTIENIAHRVGYANAFALSVAFKRIRGVSPSGTAPATDPRPQPERLPRVTGLARSIRDSRHRKRGSSSPPTTVRGYERVEPDTGRASRPSPCLRRFAIMTVTTVTLNNGVVLPALGFGVFQSSPEETTHAVAEALEVGYRHIDTAAAYFNEQEVGQAIAASGVPRGELFIETKVWLADYGYDETLHAFDTSTGKLGVNQLDVLILHQPLPTAFDRTIAAYRALETLSADGRVRAIGVSNFSIDDLNVLFAETGIVPSVNQVEIHPYFQQPELRSFHEEHAILSQAWSPLGGITFYWGDEGGASTMDDATITGIGARHGKSAAQVMLRWQIQLGHSVIPKSVKRHRMEENFAVFDFALTPAEMTEMASLDKGVRRGPEPPSMTLESHGHFLIPEA